MNLDTKTLLEIKGGAININSTFLNSLARVISTIVDLGRKIGSSISRIKNKNYCS